MVSASNARARFPRPAWKCCRTRPTVSSALKKSLPGSAAIGAVSTRGGMTSSHEAKLPLRRYLVYFGLAAFGCALDLLTKEAVFRWRGPPRQGNEWWLIANRFGIETSINPGALFGMGAGWWWLFSLLSVVAL